jgi:hypothetical protein
MSKKIKKRTSKHTTTLSNKQQTQYTTSNKQVVLYKPKTEGAYPISISCWRELKNDIKKIKPPNRFCAFLASFFAGLFGTAFISVIDMCNRDGVKNWYKITILSILFISFICAIFCFIFDVKTKKDITKSAEDVVGKMGNIENDFEPPEDTEDNNYSKV